MNQTEIKKKLFSIHKEVKSHQSATEVIEKVIPEINYPPNKIPSLAEVEGQNGLRMSEQ